MNDPTAILVANPAAVLDEVVSALRRGDLPRAERAFAAAGGAVDAEALVRLAELNVRRQRWADAAWLLDHVPGPAVTPAVSFKRNLCRNLAAMAVHRPAVAKLLGSLPPTADVSIAPSGTGHPTIAVRQADGGLAGLSADNRPLAAAEHALGQLRPALATGATIGLAGLGDGYLLYRLAGEKTELFLGMQVPVIVIEPDPHIALHALMIHDLSGPAGPIEQPRFAWYVGPDWLADLRAALDADPLLAPPAVTIGFTEAAAGVRAGLRALGAEIEAADVRTKGRVEAYYERYQPADLAGLLAPGAPRRPRVLLLTTRFSTVLQYSTRDAAAAFERLGWEARVLIEPTPHHRLYQNGIRRAVDGLRPDLVFQIDHLRHEHGDLFPPNLPFACWVQDHLPNLTSPGVGRHVGPTDFVLTDTAGTYEQKYAYPGRQLVALPKLTRNDGPAEFPRADVSPDADGPDLVYVSNASRAPAQILEELATAIPDAPLTALLRACGERMIAIYTAGGCLQTYFGDVLPLIRRTIAERGLRIDKPRFDHAARVLTHPLNDALYRQQALGWAAGAARDLGLRFELYGNRWDRHPELSAYAKGPIGYDALAGLTRRAKLNLQIVPYLCLHQRLLDGLMAGGAFLVRRHPADTEPARLLAFLESRVGPSVGTVAGALDQLPPRDRREFGRLVRACRPPMCTTGGEDVVRMVREWQGAGQVTADGPLPRLDGVTFSDAASLRNQILRHLADPTGRAAVAAGQRAAVAARLTYEAGLGRVAGRIAALLAEGAATSNRRWAGGDTARLPEAA